MALFILLVFVGFFLLTNFSKHSLKTSLSQKKSFTYGGSSKLNNKTFILQVFYTQNSLQFLGYMTNWINKIQISTIKNKF